VRKINLDITDFVLELKLLKHGSLSVAQRTILRATYGLSLNEAELAFYRRATGREEYIPREHDELSVVAGRQSGKTSRIAALIAVYEAFRDHGLPPDQRGYVFVIATAMKQAKIAFNFIKKYIHGSPTLKSLVLNTTRDEIELRNGVVIACRPCSYAAVRGYPVICVICDEMAFWCHEETAANPEREVIEALRPGMATLYNTKLVKISTPFRKEGILYDEFQQRNELEHLVWQVTTEEMNPAVTKQFLDKALQRNPETFNREHLAVFTDSISGWITPEILDPCIARGRRELPPVRDAIYAAALDPASRHNDFAFAILHRSPDGMIVVDRVARWTGTKSAPLAFESVLGEIKSILDDFGINSAVGDQWCSDVIRQYLLKLGVSYEISVFGGQTRAKLFTNLKHLLVQGKIQLLDHPELLRQLRNLQEERTDRGQIDVRPSGGMKDDLAVAVALAASELTKGLIGPAPFLMPTGERYFIPFPASCQLQAICANFPRCLDTGNCQGFQDGRLSG
jgi:Terminase large subunit, ATPase domain